MWLTYGLSLFALTTAYLLYKNTLHIQIQIYVYIYTHTHTYVQFAFHTFSVKDSSSKNRAVLDAYSVFTYNIMFACLDSLETVGSDRQGSRFPPFGVVCSLPRLLYHSRPDDDAVTTIQRAQTVHEKTHGQMITLVNSRTRIMSMKTQCHFTDTYIKQMSGCQFVRDIQLVLIWFCSTLFLLPLWHSRGQGHRLPYPGSSHLTSSVWQCCQ